MKRKYNILLLVLLLAFGSCSFTSKMDDNPDKDKLLIQIVTLALDQLHFEPKQINDSFSVQIYSDYLKLVDPLKRYLLQEDIEEFQQYKTLIDDQLKAYDISFFGLVYDRLMLRQQDAKNFYKDVLAKPFNFLKDENYNTDYEKLTYARNRREVKERWRQQLKFSTLSSFDALIEQQQEASKMEKEDSEEAFVFKSLEELELEARTETEKTLDNYFTDYIEDMERKDWFAMYVNTIVEGFDPHTSYMAPRDKDRFDQQMSGKLEGIGARLQKKMDYIKIVELISGGPAWRDGKIEVGDVIMKVRQDYDKDALSVVGMRIDDAVKLIKGPKGTKVILTMKKVDGTIKDITVTRDLVELEETYAKSSIVKKEGENYGIINLPKFYADFKNYKERNAASDIKTEIERLKQENIQGLVIDLRNNGGGSLRTVVDMAGLFIEEGPVVQVRSADRPKEVLKDTDRSITWDGPLVIMVNELSASASEILAAAMQDYKRAIIIGSKQTYGKGTVQNVMNLNRMVRNSSHGDLGALKLTRQKFYRINGGSTQLEGVKSDVVVPDRYSFIDIGERDQENPLAWDQIRSVQYNLWESSFDYNATIAKSKARMANNAQLNLIESNAKWSKEKMDDNNYSLNYQKYKTKLKLNEEEAKKYDAISDYQTDLTFESLPYEQRLFEQDTILKSKRDRWHKNLTKDVYMEEALHVLDDLKMSYRAKDVANIKK